MLIDATSWAALPPTYVTRATNTDINIIPGGLTCHLQPADVSWKKPFKQAYKALYNEWMVSGEKSYTPAGNMRPPDKSLCLKWVKDAWQSVTTDVVMKSFAVCGISSSIDGSQDSEISCIKAAETIAKTQELALANQEEEDPFADLDGDGETEEDEDELERNETVVRDS